MSQGNSLTIRLHLQVFFFSAFSPFFYLSIIIDLKSLVDDIRQAPVGANSPSVQIEPSCSEVAAALPSTVKAVQNILQLTGDTLPENCRRIETVSTQQAMNSAFNRFNDTIYIFLELPVFPHNRLLIGVAVC